MRKERDIIVELTIPANSYYGIHSLKSKNNFHISNLKLQAEIIKSMAMVKLSCAKANIHLGLLSKPIGNAIIEASREVMSGKFDDQFIVDIFQSGSGTSSHMNMNEVIAGRGSEILTSKQGERKGIHPNNHVNMGQSTNDVFPASIRVATAALIKILAKEIALFEEILLEKAHEFNSVIKAGRTHLQDAVPIRLGQVFGAFAASMSKDRERLLLTLKRINELGIGGNAVGTGINTIQGFRKKIIEYLNKESKGDFCVARNGIEATHSITDFVEAGGALKALAINVNRICNDLRLMNSGPNSGLKEINLPEVEPGSSIMAGKINPSICEAVNMVCYKVLGNLTTLEWCAAASQLELNTTMPVAGFVLIESFNLMKAGIKTLGKKCVAGISANVERCRYQAEQSPALATFLNPYIGYEKAAEIYERAIKEKKTIVEIVRDEKILSEKEIKTIFDPKNLTSPKRAFSKKNRDQK